MIYVSDFYRKPTASNAKLVLVDVNKFDLCYLVNKREILARFGNAKDSRYRIFYSPFLPGYSWYFHS